MNKTGLYDVLIVLVGRLGAILPSFDTIDDHDHDSHVDAPSSETIHVQGSNADAPPSDTVHHSNVHDPSTRPHALTTPDRDEMQMMSVLVRISEFCIEIELEGTNVEDYVEHHKR